MRNRLTYHIQRDSFTALCGRRVGTPGGKIYPGVHVQTAEWFKSHRYPDAINPVTCKSCKSKGA